MKKALVFGGSGFLGSHVVNELTNTNYDVTVIDIIKSKNPDVKFINADIANLDNLKINFQDFNLIFNFIAQPDIQTSKENVENTFNLNVIMNIKILEKIKNLKNIQYIFSSSAYAVSASGLFYGISKWTSERIIEEYSRIYGSVYGVGSSSSNRIYRFIQEAKETGKIKFKGSGEEIREFIHVKDAARLTMVALESHAPNRSFMLTGIERYSYKQLLTMIKEIFKGSLEVNFENLEYDGHYQITPYQISSSIGKKLILTEYHDMGQGIIEIINHMSSNNES